jgi:hypothetical protein
VVGFVFDNLTAKQGAEAVVGVSTLLDRLDALDNAPERKADQAALATLAARSYTDEERTRLRGLVATAQTLIMPKPISDAEREATLLKLYAWHNEWSAIARLVLTRRDHQIAVGIAKRRKAKKGEPPAVPAEKPATPAEKKVEASSVLRGSAEKPAIPAEKQDGS